MSSNQNITTNFKDSNGVDLGSKLIRKDYLLSVYPEIGQQIGIPPELWVWGLSSDGNLGTNDITPNRSTPVTTFAGGTDWKQVSAGDDQIAAIKTDGTLWTWGLAASGQLGNTLSSVLTIISTPITTFAGGTNWKQVSCSFALNSEHTAAIKTDGTLWLWGSSSNGRLANLLIVGNRSTPITTFAGGTDWKQVSCGGYCTYAIKTDGTLWSWGRGSSGQLGNADITDRSTPVTTFAGGTNWKQISGGSLFGAAIKTDGTLWTWGLKTNGQLGNGDPTSGNSSTPITTFAGGTDWKQVSCGQVHMAAIKTDGTLWVWGNGNNGQLGNASTTNTSTPVTTFAGGNNWKQVSCADNRFTLAIKTDGSLWSWGNGFSGTLGNNETPSKSTPVTTFAGGNNWKQVSAGNRHSVAIKSVDF
jgi:alpha-tubulin suppressor-like RCC1 family protein